MMRKGLRSSRSEVVMVAVGFIPWNGIDGVSRRVATLESLQPQIIQASLRDANCFRLLVRGYQRRNVERHRNSSFDSRVPIRGHQRIEPRSGSLQTSVLGWLRLLLILRNVVCGDLK